MVDTQLSEPYNHKKKLKDKLKTKIKKRHFINFINWRQQACKQQTVAKFIDAMKT